MIMKKFAPGTIVLNRQKNDQMLVINSNYSGYNVVRYDRKIERYFDEDILKILSSNNGVPDITTPLFYPAQTFEQWFEEVGSVEKSYLYLTIGLIGDFLRGTISYNDNSKWSYHVAKNVPEVAEQVVSSAQQPEETTVIPEKTAVEEVEHVEENVKPQHTKCYTLIPANDAGVRRVYTEDEVFNIANAPSADVLHNLYPEYSRTLIQTMYQEARNLLGRFKPTEHKYRWSNYFKSGANIDDVMDAFPSIKNDKKKLASLLAAWNYWQKNHSSNSISNVKYNFALYENAVKRADKLQLAQAIEKRSATDLEKVLDRNIPSTFYPLLKKDIKYYLASDIFYVAFGAKAFAPKFPNNLNRISTDRNLYNILVQISPLWDELPKSVHEKYKLLSTRMKISVDEEKILRMISTVFNNRFDNLDKAIKDKLDDTSTNDMEKVCDIQQYFSISKAKSSKMLLSYKQSPYAAANAANKV